MRYDAAHHHRDVVSGDTVMRKLEVRDMAVLECERALVVRMKVVAGAARVYSSGPTGPR